MDQIYMKYVYLCANVYANVCARAHLRRYLRNAHRPVAAIDDYHGDHGEQ